jgi:hypothetical protein
MAMSGSSSTTRNGRWATRFDLQHRGLFDRRRLGRDWQPQRGSRALSDLTREFEQSAELDRKPVNHGQPQTRSLPRRLRRKEGFDRLLERGGIHARSGIGDLNPKIRSLTEVFLRANLFFIYADAKRSSIRHSVSRVDRQIEDREFDLIGVDLRRGQPGGRLKSQNNPGTESPLKQVPHADQKRCHIGRTCRQLLLSRERQHPLGQCGAALSTLHRALE